MEFKGLSRNLLRMAIAAALPTVAPSAFAQQAPPQQLEGVTVTGIRVGIENAIETKRQSTSIVEAISAEDIGKLPDTSIAESISRLPGLTSQRAEGRASAISLRGTDPGFTTALLNGREQVSTGDNRSVEFDQYPSELLSSVVVYKTPDSQLAAQGLAGTIDLRTIRPLDYGGDAIALNLRGEQNSNDNLGADSDDRGYRASFSFIDQFMDGRFGIAFGYAHLDSPLATRGFGTYEPLNPSATGGDLAFDCPGGNADACQNNPGIAPGNIATNGMKVRADMGSTVRDGFMATLQFEPGDSYLVDPRPLLLDDGADGQRAQPRGQPQRLPGALLRARPVPGRYGFRLLRHHDRGRYGRRRHAEQHRAARSQFPVHDRRQDHGGRLAQRVPAERCLVAGGRHQLFTRRPRPEPAGNQRTTWAGDSTRHGHVPAPRQQQHAFAVVPARLHGSDHRCWSGPRSMAPATRRGRASWTN